MNANACRGFVIALLCALAPPPLLAQSEMDEAIAEMDAMVASVNAFVGDTRFDEADVRSLLEHWDDFDSLGGLDAEGEAQDMAFEALLEDPEFRDFVAAHNLAARDWLQKAIRITMSLYREQVLENAAHVPAQYEQQLQMIDSQKEQLGEEMYQDMRAAMDEGRAFVDMLVSAASRLPAPTPTEAAVLDAYRDELNGMLMDTEDEFGEDVWSEEDDGEDYRADGEDGR